MALIPGTNIDTDQVRLVEKADLLTTTATAAAQVLTNKQREQFISFGQDVAVMLLDSTRQNMTNPTEDINQISMVDGVAHVVGAAGEITAVTAAERAVPTFTRAQLDWQEYLLQIRISRRWIESNIAKERGQDQVHEECGKALWWALENAAWFGESGGSNPSGWGNRLGTLADGWRIQSTTNTYDHGGGIPNALLFHNAILTLPTRYRTPGWEQRYTFYMHPDILERFVYALQTRLTGLGDQFMISDRGVSYRGVIFTGAACMPVNIAGTGAASAYTASTTDILLCEPKNKVWGLGRDINVFTHPETDGRIFYHTYSVLMDVVFALEAAVVRCFNVRNAVS